MLLFVFSITLLLIKCVVLIPQDHVVVSLDYGNEGNINAGPNYNLSIFEINSTHNKTGNHTRNPNEGVCYIEVRTETLTKDRRPVTGNGTKPGYSRIRACCKGYVRNKHIYRQCDPVCEEPCINAVCTAPNTCTCIERHVKELSGACVVTCPDSCLNGYCSGDACVCNYGYTLDPTNKFCIPVCRNGCEHGNCTAPETCKCDRGFDLTPEGTCKAGCENCDNGQCHGPNHCVCNKGYAKNAEGFCAPVCSQGCKNGVCAAPEVCACSYGYELIESSQVCQPKCLRPCVNGFCSGPDTCSCNNGYQIDEKDPLNKTCVPICPGGCENGVCSSPNYCLCHYGFVKDRSVKGSQKCIKQTRKRRSIDPFSEIRNLLTFEIPDEYDELEDSMDLKF